MPGTPKTLQPEKTDIDLGFVPLTDCAPLVMARQQGLFDKHGLNVRLHREASWASIRDKVCFGALDGAQMLAGMPLATTLGLGVRCPMVVSMSLDLNGNAITLGRHIMAQMVALDPSVEHQFPLSADPLKKVIDYRRERGEMPLRLGMVFPSSTHNYQLRYWLAAAGIHPDRDVSLVVVPPPLMVEQLAHGKLDGFCVGEPWNTAAVEAGVGRIAMTGYELWNNSPEKVLGVTAEFAEENPQTLLAVTTAILEACAWLDAADNRIRAAEVLAHPDWVGQPVSVLSQSLRGELRPWLDAEPVSVPDFHVFYRYAANCPWRSHAVWLLTQMYRWGQAREPRNICQVADAVYRPDLYRQAAEGLGFPVPEQDHKREGEHAAPWRSGDVELGADKFMDGLVFDPKQAYAYLENCRLNTLRVPVAKLRALV